jgi:hypothetical protein
MREPNRDERQLAIYLLDQTGTGTANVHRRALLLRVINAPIVQESDLQEVRRLADSLTRERRRGWRQSEEPEPA